MEIHPEHRQFEHVPVAILVVSDGLLVYANPTWSEVFVQPREEWVGRPVTELLADAVHREDSAWLRNLHVRGEQGLLEKGEIWVRLMPQTARVPMIYARRTAGPRSGERLYALFPADADAQLQRFTAALTAGTERLMRCRTEHDVFETAVQIVFDNQLGAAVMFPEGEWVRHGHVRQPPEGIRETERILGYPITEYRFRRDIFTSVDHVMRTRTAQFHNDAKEVLRPAQDPRVMAIIDRLPDFHAVEAPLVVGGEPVGVLAAMGPHLTPAMGAAIELFARQVGAAVENARHHKRSAEQLQRVSALQDELVAHERLAALGSAAAVLAHEVRNPLGAILNGLSLLRRDLNLGPEGVRALGMVEEESNRLDRIVHDLLDFTRPLEPRLGPAELTEVARTAASVIQERGEDRGIPIQIAASQGPTIHADAHLLQLALGNLLRNAVQASPPSGTVRLFVESTADAACLVVEDDGPGITDADTAKIFEPFFTTRASGTGLGLSFVQRIARAHGGNVAVRRSATGGARFELSVPRR